MQRAKAFAVGMVFLVALAGCGSDQALAGRQAAVAEAGADVMPFSLEETTHVFTNTTAGGRQDVVADDPTDLATIEEIRAHLQHEVDKFRSGDFSDPEAIHGPAMPGLAALKAGFDRIQLDLVKTPDGAAIIYAAQDPNLVSAIHSWFQAQASDHGNHAEHNP